MIVQRTKDNKYLGDYLIKAHISGETITKLKKGEILELTDGTRIGLKKDEPNSRCP